MASQARFRGRVRLPDGGWSKYEQSGANAAWSQSSSRRGHLGERVALRIEEPSAAVGVTIQSRAVRCPDVISDAYVSWLLSRNMNLPSLRKASVS